ncbi:MAG: hypothetical protein HYT68_01470 [Candidatus Zambryskibacteria bacterium]|nr:hypothetical protein [Candidatus Zambryskibacteria bacterium]
MIASNRVEAAVRMVVDAARKAAEEAIKELESRKVLTEANFQRVLAQGDKVASAVKTTVSTTLAELAENVVGRLKLISGSSKIVVAATDGKKTLANARDVFTTYVDSDFKNWDCDVPAGPTAETEIAIYEMVKDGTFAQLYGNFGENLDRLCLTQAQIRVFARDHRNWLRADGWVTFFLFKVNGEFFVALVRVRARGLLVHVSRFSDDDVWTASLRPRIVVPQLALES